MAGFRCRNKAIRARDNGYERAGSWRSAPYGSGGRGKGRIDSLSAAKKSMKDEDVHIVHSFIDQAIEQNNLPMLEIPPAPFKSLTSTP